jgi:hypothetical protein
MNCEAVQFGGRNTRWAFSKKGNIYELEVGM